MKWLILSFGLMAFAPIFQDYKDAKNIKDEFANVEATLQDQQFEVRNTTPNLRDMKDGQIVIVSSMTYTKIMFRQNQEIYSINVSCVTIRR